MGNCVLKGFSVTEVEEMVKVATTNGGIMELFAPITAESITNDFPGHAIYRSLDIFSPPLLHNEELQSGLLYHLLPLATTDNNTYTSSSFSSSSSSDFGSVSSGVWKVKLVINPEHLTEILSQEARTGELIENLRTVAKCGNGFNYSVDAFDQSSVSSSWKDQLRSPNFSQITEREQLKLSKAMKERLAKKSRMETLLCKAIKIKNFKEELVTSELN
ncbi:uncharacterized protein LOC126687819 [Mercurialis annua]|uniref:uncharacterized protein LOC126687819 n=1 Tax=Mercurialis annua TaxID=3986 RepID=UPI00216000CC|nr:uncharacterized protein LOC126687819 [Mercurialis annua]